MQIVRKLLHGISVGVTAWALAAAGASAATLTFDFGTLQTGGASYSGSCNGTVGTAGTDCTLNGGNPQSFSTGGVTVKADAFAGNSSPAGAATVS